MSISDYFSGQIEEIDKSMSLKIYGAFLAFTHVITWYSWFETEKIANLLVDPLPICWSFMSGCSAYRSIPLALWSVIDLSYLTIGLFCIAVFFFSKKARLGYVLFFVLTVLKFLLLLIDYRMMGNYHYMPFVLSFVFLLLPQKKETILYTIVIFYISAGLLKLDTEWLSGAALLRTFFIQGELLEWILAYTVIFEVLIVPLVILSSFFLFFFSLIQILSFHIISWHIVGYFYPCIMFSLLMAFPLFRLKIKDSSISLIDVAKLKILPMIFLILLFSAQILPRVFSPDLSVDSQGRLFTLNMLDARVQCDHFSYVKTSANSYVEVSSVRNDMGTRISCDPIVYIAEAKALCRVKNVKKVPLYLMAKKSTHSEWLNILAVDNYCDNKHSMSWWGGL